LETKVGEDSRLRESKTIDTVAYDDAPMSISIASRVRTHYYEAGFRNRYTSRFKLTDDRRSKV